MENNSYEFRYIFMHTRLKLCYTTQTHKKLFTTFKKY